MRKVIDITDNKKEELRVVFAHNLDWDHTNCLVLDGDLYIDNYKDKVFLSNRVDAIEVLKNLKESCNIILEALETEEQVENKEELILG